MIRKTVEDMEVWLEVMELDVLRRVRRGGAVVVCFGGRNLGTGTGTTSDVNDVIHGTAKCSREVNMLGVAVQVEHRWQGKHSPQNGIMTASPSPLIQTPKRAIHFSRSIMHSAT